MTPQERDRRIAWYEAGEGGGSTFPAHASPMHRDELSNYPETVRFGGSGFGNGGSGSRKDEPVPSTESGKLPSVSGAQISSQEASAAAGPPQNLTLPRKSDVASVMIGHPPGSHPLDSL